jgi:transketolase
MCNIDFINIYCNIIIKPTNGWNIFRQEEYQGSVILPDVTSFALEMASPFGWERYVDSRKHVLGIDHFGASGKGNVVMEQFGFTVENVVKMVKALQYND